MLWVKNPIKHQNMIWFDTGFASGKISMFEYDKENNDFIIHQLDDGRDIIYRTIILLLEYNNNL